MAKKKTILDEFPNLVPQPNREIGIEIEMEGVNLAAGPKGWATKADGSLRGEAVEWVLERPQTEKDAFILLDRLENYLKECKSVLIPSDRCGVHIHINVQDMLVEDVIKYCLLYLVVEDILVHWCGEDREGNLFCLRGRDAEYLIRCLLETRQKNSFKTIVNKDIRYASLNLTSLAKFGSLEFRSLRTPKDFSVIKTWIRMLLEIRDAIHMFKSTEDIIEFISLQGGRSFLKKIFPTTYIHVYNQNGINSKIIDSARLLQDVAYAEKFKPKKKEGLESYPSRYWSMMLDVHRWCSHNKFEFEAYNPWTGMVKYKDKRKTIISPMAPIQETLYGSLHHTHLELMGDQETFSFTHQKDYKLCQRMYKEAALSENSPFGNELDGAIEGMSIQIIDFEEDDEFDEEEPFDEDPDGN